MKRFVFSALFFALLASGFAQQEAATLPSVNLKTLDGKKFNTADISNEDDFTASLNRTSAWWS